MSNPYNLDPPLRLPRQMCPICPSQGTTPCFKPGHIISCDHCGYEYSPLTSNSCPGCRMLGVRITHGQMMKFLDDTSKFVERTARTFGGPQVQNSRVSTTNPLATLSLGSTNLSTGMSMRRPASRQVMNTPARPVFGNPSYIPSTSIPNTSGGSLSSVRPSVPSNQHTAAYTSPTGASSPPVANKPFIPTSGATNLHTVANKLFASGMNQVGQNTTRSRVPMRAPSMSPTGVGARPATPGRGTRMHAGNGPPSLAPTGSSSGLARGSSFRNFGHDNPPLRRPGRGRGGKASARGGTESQ
ncbi:uncharacterized protein APUU_10254S [Aspergillus puulaauensis]|uniref:Uncharacterized protein n=1 Tax=Aspergillus puulaauensis TaxID=1220207 RepID=A0A7R8AFY4_9EURO|nr:uncharacterized protein APUU_10254S [Aspergillus puulaauensis]BCS17426.1 hypothetical protein APUU_10254S [Aspergillus puulaauensis]